ncbi:MAG: hypothetical protein IJG65_08625 [Synergistaceae bacterium]|nr:hypothetical protein [Synergistaceae bacterium]
MKRNSYDHDAHMREKMSAYSPNASYENAIKLYKSFATVSGIVLTAAYIISAVL